jgi:hypothetical protein
MPALLAARKCPSSWTNIRRPKVRAVDQITVKMFFLLQSLTVETEQIRDATF